LWRASLFQEPDPATAAGGPPYLQPVACVGDGVARAWRGVGATAFLVFGSVLAAVFPEEEMSDYLGDYARLILYPAAHYALIAATVILYIFVEVRQSPSREKVAAGCAAVLFCLSLIDAEKTWTGTRSEHPAQQLLEALLVYLSNPVTNILVLYAVIRNVFGKIPIKAWAYTLLSVVQAPLTAYAVYVAH
jgi:hypothetical protein